MIEVEVGAQGTGRALAAIVGNGRFTDPANARIIWMMAGGLVLLAILVLVGTIWWWRSTQVEHPALGPLEVMGSRKWWKGDYTSRVRTIEAARPAGALVDEVAGRGEPVDLGALGKSTPQKFDDLLDLDLSELLAGVAAADGVAGDEPADGLSDGVALGGTFDDLDGPAAEAIDDGQPAPADAETSIAETSAAETDTDDHADHDDEIDAIDEIDDDATADAPRAPMDPLLRLNLADTDSE